MQEIPRDLLLTILANTPSLGLSLLRLTCRRWNSLFSEYPKRQEFWERAIHRDFPILELRNDVDHPLTQAKQEGKSLEQLYFKRLFFAYSIEEPLNKEVTFTNLYDRLPAQARIGLAAAQGDFITIIRELAQHLGLSAELEEQLKTLTFEGLVTLLRAKSPETVSCIDTLRNDALTPLFLAAYNGHANIVKLLLALGASDNHLLPAHANQQHFIFDRDTGYLSAVQWACKGGDNPHIVELFLSDAAQTEEKKDDVVAEIDNKHEDTEVTSDDEAEESKIPFQEYELRNNSHHAVLQAAWFGRPRVMQMLIKRDVNFRGLHQEILTTLKMAADLGHVEVVKVLLAANSLQNEKGCKQFLNFSDSNFWAIANGYGGSPAIFEAFNNGNYQAIVELLVEAGASVVVKDRKGIKTPLDFACTKGNIDLVKYLLKKGASFTTVSLQMACKIGHTELVKLMLASELPADVHALHAACEFGHPSVVELLLEAGVPIDSRLETKTILHTACSGRRIPVIQLLLSMEGGKALINEQDSNGLTPLYCAVASDSVAEQEQCPCCAKGAHGVDNHLVVALLIAAGADVDIPANHGVSPLHLACEKKNSAVVKCLVDAHAELNIDATMMGFNGVTPLHVACFYGHVKAVEYLLEAGANFEIETENGFTPKKVAEIRGHEPIVALIEEKKEQLNPTSGKFDR